MENKEQLCVSKLLEEAKSLIAFLNEKRDFGAMPLEEHKVYKKKRDRFSIIENFFIDEFRKDPMGRGGDWLVVYIRTIFKSGRTIGLPDIVQNVIFEELLMKNWDDIILDKERVENWLESRVNLEDEVDRQLITVILGELDSG